MSIGTQANPPWTAAPSAATEGPANLPAPAEGVKPSSGIGRRRTAKPIPPYPLTFRGRLVLLHYWALFHVFRFIRWQTLRFHVVNPEAVQREGAFVIACTHLSHIEPGLLGLTIPRKVDWVARIEFYKYRVTHWLLDSVGCIPVNRSGVAVSTVRSAIARLNGGRIVGIFPEGGCIKGAEFVGRGGPIKAGACVISRRAGVPIIPVVFLGTHVLTQVLPWVPFRTFPPRRTELYIAYGRAIEPITDEPCPRRARQRQADALKAEFVRLYGELRERYGIEDTWVP